MSWPASVLIAAVKKVGLLSPEQLAQTCALTATHPTAETLAAELARRGWLTAYQATELAAGRGEALAVGSYVLLQRLGAGGMGEVFRARHRVLKRDDAVKRILADRLDSPDAIERFMREARAAAMLSHPNVVQVFDAGESNGVYYLAMELLPGVDLARHLAKVGPLPVMEAVEYVRQACVGMQHAHERGLVHRDLKPANLMLGDGQVKVMDMGLALVANARTITQSGGAFGTADYVAPEQVMDSHKVDIRADVYALGCTLYQLLVGVTPFHEAHPAARPMMHASHEPIPVERRRPEVPERLAAIVRKMMAKSPRDRYRTPGEAAAALAALLGGEPKSAGTEPLHTRVPPPLPATTLLPKPRGPSKWLIASAGAALVAVLACLGAFALLPRERRQTDEPQPDEAKLPNEFANEIGMRFVRIEAGKFALGSPPDEKHRRADEGPQHEVEIARDFWLGTCEVTQGQYRAVMGHNPSYFSHDGEKSPKGEYAYAQPRAGSEIVKSFAQKQLDEFPVECVSWQDALDFVDALNARAKGQKFSATYRLPTEAEWEFACRNSGAYAIFSFGDGLSSKQANFNGDFPFGGADRHVHLGRTARVGSYSPNSRGLFDMHGNVWEWCQDSYDENYYAGGPRRDPLCLKESPVRVVRGGSWNDGGLLCRTAFRGRIPPGARFNHLGFRVALVPAP